MPDNAYHFITTWQVEATVEEVKRVLGDATGLTRWWPSVYLDVQQLEPGDETGMGSVVSLYTKGWLPYTLRWTFRTTEVKPEGFTIEAYGDFVRRGIWTFEQEGTQVKVVYDWKITAEKPLLKRLSFLLKSIFSANHHWAMARGLESLVLELRRRRTVSPEAKAKIPAPPPATPSASLKWLVYVIGIRSSTTVT
jgi:hypothetical protein